jgi:hypothetical protein
MQVTGIDAGISGQGSGPTVFEWVVVGPDCYFVKQPAG